MLLFRSEEHIDRWLEKWGRPRGESFSPDQCWGLAQGWFGAWMRDRRKKTPDEAQQLFNELGLTSEFWKLS